MKRLVKGQSHATRHTSSKGNKAAWKTANRKFRRAFKQKGTHEGTSTGFIS